MIELKPYTYNNFQCPECNNGEIDTKDIIFQGIHVLADCQCKKCNSEFITDFPFGQALFTPQTINKYSKSLYNKHYNYWFADPLIESFLNKSNKDIKIEKKVYANHKSVVILNCIDYLYGHVLLKLLNAQNYLDNNKDCGLIIIIPKSFEWLIPEGIAEVWLLDISLKDTKNWYLKLENFVKEEIKKYDEVFLSLAFSHPDFSKINIERFVKVKKYDFSGFTDKEINITFILRKDRIWINSELAFFVRLFERLHLIKYSNKLTILFQKCLVERTILKIKDIIPNANFNIVGLGSFGTFLNFINNYCETDLNTEKENNWCKF